VAGAVLAGQENLVGRQVEQLVTAQPQIDAAALAKSSVVVQGLSAYEYILFDSKPDVANAEQKAATARCWWPSASARSNWPKRSCRAGTAPTACSRR
jgi:predicted lipoprotein